MKFTAEIAVALLLFGAPAAQTQTAPKTPPKITVVTDSKFFCKLEEFVGKKGPAGAVKKCAKMVDSVEKSIQSAEACKEYGLNKGQECIKVAKAEQIQVKLKFTEQFGANKNFSMWTCELDKSGGSACP